MLDGYKILLVQKSNNVDWCLVIWPNLGLRWIGCYLVMLKFTNRKVPPDLDLNYFSMLKSVLDQK